MGRLGRDSPDEVARPSTRTGQRKSRVSVIDMRILATYIQGEAMGGQRKGVETDTRNGCETKAAAMIFRGGGSEKTHW